MAEGRDKIEIVPHESLGAEFVQVMVSRREVFVERVVVPVDELDVGGLKRRVSSLRGCRLGELGCVVSDVKKFAESAKADTE